MPPSAFDDLSDAYEAMIDWPRRLAAETPFYRWLMEQIGQTRLAGRLDVLDAACGTGHHVELLQGWGHSVEGADLSPAMIERCRRRLGESPDLRWQVRGFDEPAGQERFDLALCVGNSLALAADKQTIAQAVSSLLMALRPGGLLVIQVANLWRLPDGPCQWQKCTRARLPGGEALIIKGIHRAGARGFVDLLLTPPDAPRLRSECIAFHGLEAEELEGFARAGGATRLHRFGGYDRSRYERATSADLILVAGR